jgi:hypothetical protein
MTYAHKGPVFLRPPERLNPALPPQRATFSVGDRRYPIQIHTRRELLLLNHPVEVIPIDRKRPH